MAHHRLTDDQWELVRDTPAQFFHQRNIEEFDFYLRAVREYVHGIHKPPTHEVKNRVVSNSRCNESAGPRTCKDYSTTSGGRPPLANQIGAPRSKSPHCGQFFTPITSPALFMTALQSSLEKKK